MLTELLGDVDTEGEGLVEGEADADLLGEFDTDAEGLVEGELLIELLGDKLGDSAMI